MPDVILLNRRPTVVGLPNGMKLPPDPQGRGFALPLEKYEAIKGLRAFQSLLKAGVVSIKGSSLPAPAAVPKAQPKPSPADALSPDQLGALEESNVEEAGLLVNATDNLELLHSWLAADKRVTVRRMIEKRLEALDPANAPELEADEDDAEA